MIRLENIVMDRGSKYAVSGGPAPHKAACHDFVKTLKKQKKYAKATHHSWACLSRTDGPLKDDDGETGAGAVILRMLERAQLYDTVIIVTRWYGGIHLGGDRFAHIVTCVRAFLDHVKDDTFIATKN